MALLVLVRHAKSDWDVPVPDRERPLAGRGRRQAPAIGTWLQDNGIRPDVVLVSPAVRARATWDLVAAGLPAPPRVLVVDAAYTFDGDDLLDVLADAPAADVLGLVGHNPALEELVEALTGRRVRLPTSAMAVLESADGQWRRGSATLRWAGRPADDPTA